MFGGFEFLGWTLAVLTGVASIGAVARHVTGHVAIERPERALYDAALYALMCAWIVTAMTRGG